MSRKSHNTLILVTENVVVRADSGAAAGHWLKEPAVYERVAESSLYDCVHKALEPVRPLPGRLIILSTDVWNQLVKMSRVSIEALDTEQLRDALKFEVEPLVGIDAASATLGFCELPGDSEHRQFWTNVHRQTEFDAIQVLLRSKRVRDFVLAHPIVASDDSGQAHIEFWDQAAFQISDKGVLQQANQSGGDSQRWVADFGYESLSAALSSCQWLTGPQSSRPALFAGSSNAAQDLDNPETLGAWLHRAAQQLANIPAEARPLIRQKRESTGAAAGWVLRVAAMLAVVGFCTWHLAWLKGTSSQLQNRIVEMEQPAIEKQKYDSLLASLMQKRENSIQQAQLTRGELQRLRFFFEHQTDRIHTLLGKLVELRTNELVIKEIAVTEQGTVVSGVSLNSDAAPLLTSRLRDSVSDAGWEIHPASQQGQLKMTNGGPWTFSILLEDTGPPMPLSESRQALAQGGGP